MKRPVRTLNRESTERLLELSLNRHQQLAARKIAAVVLHEMEQWQLRFPKRRLSFMDAMGSVCLWVDDTEVGELERMQARGSVESNKRRARLVAPLTNIRRWYIEVSHEHHVCIEDIFLERRTNTA